MTTDKTPATLATVKHGGCVQLGDSITPAMVDAACNVLYAYWPSSRKDYRDNCRADARAALEAALAARQPVEQSVEEDVYCAIADMIEPYVQREGINPNGALPASVHDSVAILLDHWLKTRQPAQAVDLGQLPHGIRLIEIPGRNNLDPINVFVKDYELGRGRIVVTCYGQAWCGFWGAMGDRTVMQFVAACDADYVAGNMLSGRHEHVKKHERAYVERIATEVIAEFRALIGSQAVQS